MRVGAYPAKSSSEYTFACDNGLNKATESPGYSDQGDLLIVTIGELRPGNGDIGLDGAEDSPSDPDPGDDLCRTIGELKFRDVGGDKGLEGADDSPEDTDPGDVVFSTVERLKEGGKCGESSDFGGCEGAHFVYCAA